MNKKIKKPIITLSSVFILASTSYLIIDYRSSEALKQNLEIVREQLRAEAELRAAGGCHKRPEWVPPPEQESADNCDGVFVKPPNSQDVPFVQVDVNPVLLMNM